MRLAVVNSRSEASQDNRVDLDRARRYIAAATDADADLILLPETFPGRWRSPIEDTPTGELAAMAADAGAIVVGGFPEPLADDPHRAYNTVGLFDARGGEIGRYRRTTPEHAPWIYEGGKLWDFDWVPADELPVFDVGRTTVGVLVCSELFVPELSRILVLQGAEVLLMPAGVIRPSSDLYAAWRTVAWSRAIENLAAVALCSNATPATEDSLACVCAPETVLLEAHEEGVHMADIDLERIRWLRAEQDRLFDGPKPWKVKPGVLRDWRRPAVLAPHAERLTAMERQGLDGPRPTP